MEFHRKTLNFAATTTPFSLFNSWCSRHRLESLYNRKYIYRLLLNKTINITL